MLAPTEDVVAPAPPARAPGAVVLDWFERVGNRFPDPIILFLAALAATWAASSLLAGRDFGLIDPRTSAALQVRDQLTVRALAMPPAVTIVGIVLLTAAIDFLVPSASAKWALLAPILVPMLMGAGIAPELTQAAFRVGDGPVNLMTPLMPYFPLVLAFCRRYVTGFQVGTLMSLLLPFGAAYLVLQIGVLLLWWMVGLPLGIGGRYVVP
jgi:aminobenzoyl-glutamate transport protein